MPNAEKLPGIFFGPPTLVDLLRHRAEHQPDNIAFTYLVDGENERIDITNRELDRQARAIAAWLESLNLAGQRALLLYPPGLEFIAAFFGCLYAGVVAVPAYPPRRNRSLSRIQAIADDAEAKIALTTSVVVLRVEPLIDQTPHLKALTWLATDRIQGGLEDLWEPPDIKGDTLAFVQYTSGSTGTPKGVMLNHSNLIHNSALIAYAFEHTRSSLGVFWLPSYHDMGLIGGILQPLYMGCPNVLMSPMAFLQKPYRWLSAISRFGATTSGGPNFAYDLCVRKITDEQKATLDLSSWHVAFNGAEPVRADTLERFAEAFAPCGFRREAFYPCFGMAEATLIVSGGYAKQPPVVRWMDGKALLDRRIVDGPPAQNGSRALVGCGSTLPDQKIVIADPETMTTCPPDRVGEIWVQGASIAQGYWRQPEATEATFRARLADSGQGPFLRTGDLGFLRDGELFVTGRIKDLIIFRGRNIYPQDIEKTVEGSHPYLVPNNTAAFRVETDGQERLVVVQELERRKKEHLDAVFEAVRRAVSAEHDLPVDAIVLVHAGSIPKTSSGKIQRHACRDGYLAGTLTVVAEWHAEGEPAAATAKVGGPAKRNGDEPADATDEPADMAAVSPVGTPAVRSRRIDLSEPRSEAAAAVPHPEPAATAVPSKNGDGAIVRQPIPTSFDRISEIVLEEVRRVARERANGLGLDSPIPEIGLDSLERMEILAALEERFGGRFPEEILPQLETARDVVQAVQQYLGSEPRAKAARPAGAEVTPDCYEVARFPEYVKLRQNLDFLELSEFGNPYFVPQQGASNDRARIRGREMINYSACNYLGMSGDPAVTKAVQEAVAQYGSSASASRLVAGERDVHRELEAALARFLGVEAALAFVGGHSTNETVIGHLFRPGDLILHDALSHNSIVQGSILSGARRRPFAHNDAGEVDRLLAEARHEHRRVLVVVEGVYPIDGDIPDLPRFVEVKKRHKALLMVDEAHSIGTLGSTGRGIGEHFGVDRRDVDIWMGTLSKALGSSGGYIAGSQELVEYLKYTAPGFVFATGIAPPAAAAALAACRLLEAEPQRVRRLQERAQLFRSLAKSRGLNTGRSEDSPVVPIVVGNSVHSLELSRALFERGISVFPVVHPAVEEIAARLRFFLCASHREEQISHTIDALIEEWRRIDPAFQASQRTQAVAAARG